MPTCMHIKQTDKQIGRYLFISICMVLEARGREQGASGELYGGQTVGGDVVETVPVRRASPPGGSQGTISAPLDDSR